MDRIGTHSDVYRALRSTFLHKGLLVVGGLVTALLLIEGVFRVHGFLYGVDYHLYYTNLTHSDRLPKGLLYPDDVLKARLTPDTRVLAQTSDFSVSYDINSLGLRDRAHGYERVADEFVVLAFGDSFTFGEGVAYGDRFTEVAEDGLYDTEILNFGVPGYGSDQALLYYFLEGRNYDADIVVLFTNLLDIRRADVVLTDDGNIDLDAWNAVILESNTSTLYRRHDDPLFTHNLPSIYSYWHSLSYMRYHLLLAQLRQEMQAEDRSIWDQIALDQAAQATAFEAETLIKRTKLLAESFQAMTEERGQQFVLVNIDTPQAVAFLRDIPDHIRVLDLSSELAALSSKQPLTFTYDQHYNPATHRLIGERVASYLLTEFGTFLRPD